MEGGQEGTQKIRFWINRFPAGIYLCVVLRLVTTVVHVIKLSLGTFVYYG
jgi:hypothetical protein